MSESTESTESIEFIGSATDPNYCIECKQVQPRHIAIGYVATRGGNVCIKCANCSFCLRNEAITSGKAQLRPPEQLFYFPEFKMFMHRHTHCANSSNDGWHIFTSSGCKNEIIKFKEHSHDYEILNGAKVCEKTGKILCYDCQFSCTAGDKCILSANTRSEIMHVNGHQGWIHPPCRTCVDCGKPCKHYEQVHTINPMAITKCLVCKKCIHAAKVPFNKYQSFFELSDAVKTADGHVHPQCMTCHDCHQTGPLTDTQGHVLAGGKLSVHLVPGTKGKNKQHKYYHNSCFKRAKATVVTGSKIKRQIKSPSVHKH